MTSSIREKITLAVVALVQPTTGLSGRVWRSRQEAFSRGSAPAVVVETVSNEPQPNRAGVTTMPHHLDMRLLLLIDASIPDEAADPILVDIHDRFMLDVTLGGLASNIEPGTTSWGMEVDGLAVVETHYVVKYRTLIKDLTRAV